jgi:hypothetical protein
MISSYWANFAAAGGPNGKGLPQWWAIGEEPETMELGDKPGAISVAGDKAKLDFFKKVFSRPAPPQVGPTMP